MEGLIGTIGAALVALIGRLTVNSRPNRVRKTLADTLPLYKEAKDNGLTDTADTLAAVLAAQAKHIQELEAAGQARRYDLASLVVGVALGAPFAVGFWWLWFEVGGWWRIVGALSAAMALLLFRLRHRHVPQGWGNAEGEGSRGPASARPGSATTPIERARPAPC